MPHAELKFSQTGDVLKNWIADLAESAEPYEATVKLEGVLQAAFGETQAATHVITGSLKASGKTESDMHEDEWVGTIEYGGELWAVPSPGPARDPVDYAIYEMARGGDHDFFGPLVAYEGKIEEILVEHFKG